MSPDDSTLPTPPASGDADAVGHPERIGPYRILQILGEGGMGVVYEAEQMEPVRRRVALKIMKVGMDTREVVARFEVERQALAVMSHPGIAKVLDAGVSETGRPYFAMELVRGVPITDYCDSRTLSTSERLELFLPVCQAIQHAHQKGVIHRDLKPSNVMITEVDGQPAPKIIDFGIAKAVGQHLTDRTLVTSYGQAMGTPAYMSPEQAEMTGLDVDTRADVYSLGVLLYELLVGELPVDPTQVGLPGFIAQLVLHDTDPPTPSARVATLHQRRAYIASSRRTDLHSLRRQLRGDLDWIVMKAMAKDRTHRYETANGLAMDLQRYLTNEPVVARPPSAGYRLGKFARRNRAGVVAAGIVALAIMGSTAATAVGFVRATRAEEQARREAAAAAEVSDFLVGLFQLSDPSETRGHSVTARELLDSGAVRIASDLADQPLVQARLMSTMGAAYRGLGHLDVAAPLLEESLKRLVAEVGDDDLRVAHVKTQLAYLLIFTADYERAERLNREALATYRRTLGDTYDPELAWTVNNLVFGFLRSQSNYDEGEALLRELLAAQREAGLDDADMAATMDHLCWTLLNKGDLDAADETCLQTLALRRSLYGSDHFAIAVSLHRAGVTHRLHGRYDRALAAYREALAMNRRMYGNDHHELAYNALDLAETFRALGEADSALAYAREAVRIRRVVLHGDNPERSAALYLLAGLLRDQGAVGEAATIWLEALEVEERGLAERDDQEPDAVLARTRYLARRATTLRLLGRKAEAQEYTARAGQVLDPARQREEVYADAPALTLNAVCWWGSLAGHARLVLDLCDAAVEASDDSNRPRIRDSRGLARALTGDVDGAIADFEAYMARPANVSGVAERRAWIEALRRGANPLTHEVLDKFILP
jgi:non-specific serine/threonine protein kinase/serine/threonine-protein kinase